jgi:hypothetical protein
VPLLAVPTARLVHVSITHPCQHAIGHLVDSTVISTNLHNWDGENPYHEAFAYRADVVFLSATALTDCPATLRRIIDSNGAGDAFVSGFLFGHLAGEPVDTCLQYGAIAGAHACTVPSTRIDPIDRPTLLDRAASQAERADPHDGCRVGYRVSD